MTGHAWPLERWHEAIGKAIRDRAIDAIPVILVRMTRDGWAEEAEEARRAMDTAAQWASARPSLGEQVGHDRDAAMQLEILAAVYRRHGLDGLREAVDGFFMMSSAEADRTILVEAVLTLNERRPGARVQAQRAADRSDAAEETDDRLKAWLA